MANVLRIGFVDDPSELGVHAEAMGRLRGVTVAGTAHHGAADLRAVAAADIVLVRVRADGFDRCAGLLDVERLAHRIPRSRLVAVVDGPLGPVARLRADEAGAGHLLDIARLSDGPTLRALAERPPTARWRDVPRLELLPFGLHAGSRPGAGLRYVIDHDLQAAFEAGPTLAASVLTRRRAITVRATLQRIVGIEVAEPGSGAVLPRTTPPWRQVHAVISAARGASAPG